MVLSPGSNSPVLRKAVIRDVKPIHRLLYGFAEQGLLLARSLSELYDHLRDFYVLEDENRPDWMVGACALGVCWDDLAEIRSLAVAEECQGMGYGRRLVEACLEEARALGIHSVFALTYVDPFFRRLGFVEVEKSVLPHKVWADCLKCAKFPDCDETAMTRDL
ncbi:MAG: N-acetyltransferase [Thermodesulfobacteriota bacterium]